MYYFMDRIEANKVEMTEELENLIEKCFRSKKKEINRFQILSFLARRDDYDVKQLIPQLT